MRLKELGVNKYIKDIIGLNSSVNVSQKEMIETQRFINDNRDRIKHMMSLFADKKSKQVWKAVMMYRKSGKQIPKSLWSDNDQYFPCDIISTQENEIFVDGGVYRRYNILFE